MDERTSFEKGSDPGAAKLGNFINYYHFHSPHNRSKNLTSEMFPKITTDKCVCLDIGCNTGELTQELFKILQSIYSNKTIVVLGVDIDPILIQRAKEISENPHLIFSHQNILSKEWVEYQKSFLNDNGKEKFDITFCFSVSMWIHLNNGDAGLKYFLDVVATNSNSLLIEPQPWKCYKSARRRMQRSGTGECFPEFANLELRENVEDAIEELIIQSGFHKKKESPRSNWQRKIVAFERDVQC